MGNLLDKLNGLFTKVNETEERYESALEQKEQSLLVLQSEIQDKQKEVTELHKMKLLGDITEETFDEKNESFLKLQAKYRQGQKEVAMIQQYKVSDVSEILEELQATQKEYSASERREVYAMQMELLDMKVTYLKKMREVALRYNKTVAPATKIQMIQQRLGLKRNVYVAETVDALNMVSIANGGYVNLRVEQMDVYNAISTGGIDGQLNKLVKDAREKGLL